MLAVTVVLKKYSAPETKDLVAPVWSPPIAYPAAGPVILLTTFKVIVYFLGDHKTVCSLLNAELSESSVAVQVYTIYPVAVASVNVIAADVPDALPPLQA